MIICTFYALFTLVKTMQAVKIFENFNTVERLIQAQARDRTVRMTLRALSKEASTLLR